MLSLLSLVSLLSRTHSSPFLLFFAAARKRASLVPLSSLPPCPPSPSALPLLFPFLSFPLASSFALCTYETGSLYPSSRRTIADRVLSVGWSCGAAPCRFSASIQPRSLAVHAGVGAGDEEGGAAADDEEGGDRRALLRRAPARERKPSRSVRRSRTAE